MLKISQTLQTFKKENRSAIYKFSTAKTRRISSNTISTDTNHLSPAPPCIQNGQNVEATAYRNLNNCDVLLNKSSAAAKTMELLQIEREVIIYPALNQ